MNDLVDRSRFNKILCGVFIVFMVLAIRFMHEGEKSPDERLTPSPIFEAEFRDAGLRIERGGYLIARAFGGDPTPPGIFSGAEVRKNS